MSVCVRGCVCVCVVVFSSEYRAYRVCFGIPKPTVFSGSTSELRGNNLLFW